MTDSRVERNRRRTMANGRRPAGHTPAPSKWRMSAPKCHRESSWPCPAQARLPSNSPPHKNWNQTRFLASPRFFACIGTINLSSAIWPSNDRKASSPCLPRRSQAKAGQSRRSRAKADSLSLGERVRVRGGRGKLIQEIFSLFLLRLVQKKKIPAAMAAIQTSNRIFQTVPNCVWNQTVCKTSNRGGSPLMFMATRTNHPTPDINMSGSRTMLKTRRRDFQKWAASIPGRSRIEAATKRSKAKTPKKSRHDAK